MLTKDAINFFPTKSSLARAAGVKVQSVYNWKELVPEARAYRLYLASDGVLQYDRKAYDEYRKKKLLKRKAGGSRG